jgi:hypothetical protein
MPAPRLLRVLSPCLVMRRCAATGGSNGSQRQRRVKTRDAQNVSGVNALTARAHAVAENLSAVTASLSRSEHARHVTYSANQDPTLQASVELELEW